MPDSPTRKPSGLLNEETSTLHKPAGEPGDLKAKCDEVEEDCDGGFRRVVVESAVQMPEVTKCGNCFEE